MHNCWLLTDVFHNIDLATFRPTYGVNIIAEHPESRPYALPERNLHPCFDLAVFESVFPLRLYAGGSEIFRTGLDRAYDQMTLAVLENVLGVSRIDLKL